MQFGCYGLASGQPVEGSIMELSKMLKSECIETNLTSRTKSEVLVELMNLLVRGGEIQDKEAALEAVKEREKTMTTGVGQGLALPHAKSSAVKELCLALGIAREGIDFQSLDGKPVNLLFLLMATEGTPGPHIQALSKIARLTKSEDFRNKLMQAKSSGEVMELIRQAEKLPAGAGAQAKP